MTKIAKFFIYIILYPYFFSLIWFVPYYNWKYANENGFVKWILLGEIVASGKAFIWPYFAFSHKPESNLSHFINSINYSNEAAKLNDQGKLFSSVSESEMKGFIDLKRKALEEGKLVDIEKLNNDHPNFGNHFRDEYLKGLQLLIDGFDKHQDQDFIQVQILLDKWGDWYIANLDNIKNGIKTEVQPVVSKNISEEQPKLNADELDKYSSVLKKANSFELTESDLNDLRSAIKSYTSRTGRKLTQDEYDSFVGIMKTSNDYIYELGQSLLYTWDQKKITTTNKFDELYKTMQLLKVRKEQKLKNDLETLKAAAANQPYIEDEFGTKYTFGREVIIQHIKQNELSNKNTDKLVSVMKEFTK